jgi:hypothetical protein
MIPFEHTWPYELFGDDVYFHECPACGAGRVLLTLKRRHLLAVAEGERRLLVMPCCGERIRLIGADGDYVLADRPMRRFGEPV